MKNKMKIAGVIFSLLFFVFSISINYVLANPLIQGDGDDSYVSSESVCVDKKIQKCDAWCTAPGATCDSVAWSSSCAGSWYNNKGYQATVECCVDSDCPSGKICNGEKKCLSVSDCLGEEGTFSDCCPGTYQYMSSSGICITATDNDFGNDPNQGGKATGVNSSGARETIYDSCEKHISSDGVTWWSVWQSGIEPSGLLSPISETKCPVGWSCVDSTNTDSNDPASYGAACSNMMSEVTSGSSSNTAPTALITIPDSLDNPKTISTLMFNLTGTGSDVDSGDTIAEYRWYKNGSCTGTALYIGTSVPNTSSIIFSQGTWVIGFKVKDNNNAWSNCDSRTIIVSPSATPTPTVTPPPCIPATCVDAVCGCGDKPKGCIKTCGSGVCSPAEIANCAAQTTHCGSCNSGNWEER